MNKVSVVIPTYNHWELVLQVFGDLLRNCKDSLHEVLIVNDASTDEDFSRGLAMWKENNILPIKELRLKENRRFLRASNKGMARASGDILILLSNDVRIYKDICKEISDIISHDEKVLIGGRYLDWNTGWNTFDGRIYPYLEGWLLACTKKTWMELGGFDDRYAPNDFEDIDISTTAIQNGYTLVSLTSSATEHLGAQSIGYNPEREAITIQNKEKFRQKWIV